MENSMTFKIDKAPGKDLIPKIIEQGLFSDFYEFYKIRVDWYDYPLIHDRYATYGLFDDLSNEVPENKDLMSKYINYSIQIAEAETDKRFLNSLFLVMHFCSLAKDYLIPSQEQIEKITGLRERVQKFSFFPNITTFWNHILEFLAIEQSFDKKKLVVQEGDYQNYIDLNFKNIDNNTPISCPVELQQIEKEIEDINGEYEPLRFVRSASIDGDKYWVWLYKNISGNVWSWYITVKQDVDGKIIIEKHWMHCGVAQSPERLLLDYHYRS
jgi:hypothetical protein